MLAGRLNLADDPIEVLLDLLDLLEWIGCGRC